MPSSLAASLEGLIPMTPPHIVAGGSGDTAAPTAPVEIVERLEDSFPPLQWNVPVYKGKGSDAQRYYRSMRATMQEGPVIPRPPPWSHFATASHSHDSSTRTCYSTTGRFGDSAATSISEVTEEAMEKEPWMRLC